MHYNLGKLFSVQDNWEPARKALEAAVRLDPKYLEALDALGFALEALGDDAGAVARYEQAIALNQERQGRFASAHVSLSAYYNRTGDPDKALEYARQALELDPKSDARLVPAGEGAGAPGPPRRGGGLAQPGHRAQSPGLRRTTTSWPTSIAGSARRTRARRPSTPSSASSASRTSSRRCAASTARARRRRAAGA